MPDDPSIPLYMRYVFNEISTRNIAPDVDTAHGWLHVFFEICDQSGIRSGEKISIVSVLKFSQIFFHHDTSFTNWIKTLKDIEFKRRVLSRITKDPIKIDYPYYYYENVRCQGLGFAFENDCISLSYGSEHWEPHELDIVREQFDEEGEAQAINLRVKHIASMGHLNIYFPVRAFRYNPKHDRVWPLANKGEKVSILECSHERAFHLLCGAVGEKGPDDKQLFHFDEEAGKYIVFYRHANHEYHAYHTDDENEIPLSIKTKLKQKFSR